MVWILWVHSSLLTFPYDPQSQDPWVPGKETKHLDHLPLDRVAPILDGLLSIPFLTAFCRRILSIQ